MKGKERCVQSAMLFPDGTKMIFIEHNGMKYTLRITKENKLILTK
ncbi:hemin uptake protein HemP [Sulfurovum sp.]|nr:hemin uptake protein HemP [Sulfurovum sp.]MDD3499124.1 hemin uptake protein HemP [Sulfurovum sp.]MDY0402194.1 hemin uptake protein HemP [Sulfurovum sp.]